MRMADLIENKREGGHLSKGEIRFIIDGYVQGTIPDYQIAAWAMAVYFRGMSAEETAELKCNFYQWIEGIHNKARSCFKSWLLQITEPHRKQHTRNWMNPQIMSDISGVSYFSWKSYFSKGCLAHVETIEKIGQAFGSSCSDFLKYAGIDMANEDFQQTVSMYMRWKKFDYKTGEVVS